MGDVNWNDAKESLVPKDFLSRHAYPHDQLSSVCDCVYLYSLLCQGTEVPMVHTMPRECNYFILLQTFV